MSRCRNDPVTKGIEVHAWRPDSMTNRFLNARFHRASFVVRQVYGEELDPITWRAGGGTCKQIEKSFINPGQAPNEARRSAVRSSRQHEACSSKLKLASIELGTNCCTIRRSGVEGCRPNPNSMVSFLTYI
jgi:hypothetical protein